MVWCERPPRQARPFQCPQKRLRVVVGPEDKESFATYWSDKRLPFIGLPDPSHTVLKRYGQQTNLFKLGRMPDLAVVDKSGTARYVHGRHSAERRHHITNRQAERR